MIETKYQLKIVKDIVFIEKLYWDESEPKVSQRHKAKQLILGKLDDPSFFIPENWIKKLMA